MGKSMMVGNASGDPLREGFLDAPGPGLVDLAPGPGLGPLGLGLGLGPLALPPDFAIVRGDGLPPPPPPAPPLLLPRLLPLPPPLLLLPAAFVGEDFPEGGACGFSGVSIVEEEGTLGAPFGGPLARVVPLLLAGGEVGAALTGREEVGVDPTVLPPVSLGAIFVAADLGR